MQSINYELIIVISNQGFVDEIMDTAKKRGQEAERLFTVKERQMKKLQSFLA